MAVDEETGELLPDEPAEVADFVPDGQLTYTKNKPPVLTPPEIEREINRLLNAVDENQVHLMRLRTQEVDAKIEYERAHLKATMGDDCPKVARGGVTVSERADWIRDREFDEYVAYEHAKKRTRNCQDYMGSLEQQCSLVQSLAKSVLASFYGGGGDGGSSQQRGGRR